MAFGSFIQTNFGRQLDAKHYAGKGLRFSRMALGDGDIETASVYDVTALKSEKLSLKIDVVSVTDDEAIVTASLLSSNVDTGFNLKEMALMATDPDTNEEGAYSYNRDSSDGEYVPDKNSSTTLSEYLRVRCKVEDTENITFDASGNPLYITKQELASEVEGQIAAMKGVTGGLALYDTLNAHISDTVAHMTQTQKDQLAAAVPNSRKINGHALTGDVNLTKSDLGLGNIDNTADANKSVNYANSAGYAGSAGSAPANGGTATYATYSSHAVSSSGSAVRNNTISSSSPSGGQDGDTWDYIGN
ncbi:hypothetical protein [Caproicibacter sp.]|uniref:hypothetical protein n=1 Tax=Caproicibacter sp. TaxID=2814884 RepID=UPI003989C1B8